MAKQLITAKPTPPTDQGDVLDVVPRSCSVVSPMRISNVFSVPIAEFNLEPPGEFWRELINLILAQETQGQKFGKVGQHGNGLVFESHSDLFSQEDPLLRQISAFCHVALASVIRELTDHTEAEFEKLVFDYQAWYQITRTDGFQGFHNQPNGSWAGLFVIDPGDEARGRPESGSVMLHDARVNASYFQDEGNTRLKYPAKQCAYKLDPTQGKLFIFPSFVQQETFAYFGKRPRIIVHFNCWIRTDIDIPRITQDRSRIALLNPVSPTADFDRKASVNQPTAAAPENEDQ